MRKENLHMVMLSCIALLPLSAFAQKPVTYLQKGKQVSKVEVGKMEGSTKLPAIYLKSSPAIKEAFFPDLYKKELLEKNPQLQKMQQKKVPASIARESSEDDGLYALKDGYKFTGFNKTAGGYDSQSYGIPGMETFNIYPFANKAVTSGYNFTENAFYACGKYYTFSPAYSKDYSQVVGVDCMTYNPLTWTMTDSVRIDATSFGDVPYLSTYDENNGLVYTVSLSNEGSKDSYYLNVLDLNTFKMKRLTYLGGYDSSDGQVAKRIITPKSLLFANDKLYLLDLAKDLYEVNPVTGDLTKVATLPIRHAADAYGIQGLVYDSEAEVFLLNFFSLNTGTIYYKINLEGGDDYDQLEVDSICHPNRGYKYFFETPSAEEVNNDRMAAIQDLNIALDGKNATATFAVPAKTIKGEDIPSSAVTRIVFYETIDGEWVDVPSSIMKNAKAGEKVTIPIKDLSDGRHVISFACRYTFDDSYSGKGINAPLTTAKILYVGTDAPSAVLNPIVSIENNKPKISWKAPAEGQNTQYGAAYDPSTVKYTVKRNSDQKIIAKDITATECYDNEVDNYIAHYGYTIIPSIDGQVGDEAVTNTLFYGKYGKMPYLETFDEANSFDGFTVLSPDNSGRAWYWSNGAANDRFNMNSSKNEWLITPAFQLDDKHVYLFSYDYRGGDQESKDYQRMKITMGKENTIAAQNTVIKDYPHICTSKFINAKHYINVKAAGDYNFGFFDYSGPQEDRLVIDNVAMSEYTVKEAPDSVTNLKMTAGTKGTLQAIVSFKTPTKAIDGKNLTSLSELEILNKDDKVIKTIENPELGKDYTFQFDALQGSNNFTVVTYNDKGIGLPSTVSNFVGVDVAQAPSNFNIVWGSDNETAVMSWDKSTENGVNGGYVDPSKVTYTIYKYDEDEVEYVPIKEGITGNTFTYKENMGDGQDYVSYYVAAVNAQGESSYANAGVNLGKPYDLKFEENFSDGMTTGPWINGVFEGKCAWVGDPGIFDLTVPVPKGASAYFLLRNTTQKPAGANISLPLIEVGKAEHPQFSLLAYHSTNAAKGTYLKALVSTNGKDFTTTLDSVALNDNAGWMKHVFDLSAFKGKKVLIAIQAYLPDPATRVFVTDPVVEDAKGNDLAVSGLATEDNGTVGSKTNIKVTVSNLGATDAKDYILDIVGDDETILAEEMPDEALKSGNMKVFNFELPVTAADLKGKKLHAYLDYEDDNINNNVSDTIDFAPRSNQLPVPTQLKAAKKAEGKALLTWQAPEVEKGHQVTRNFDDLRPFIKDDIYGWKTVDGDQETTITFQTTTSGNDWPNRGAQMAWEVWNAAGAGTEDALLAYSGRNALVSFAASGYYPGNFRAPGQNNDWLISPEILGGSNLSFKGVSLFSSSVGESDLEILYSTTYRDTADFKHLETISLGKLADDEWEDVNVQLPADAKYVALRNIGTNYGIMIDDMTYTLAETPVLQGYNLYRNQSAVSGSLIKGTSYEDNKAISTAKYGVSAVYDLGESDLSEIAELTTGIKEVTSTGVGFYLESGAIRVSGATGKRILVYGIDGVKAVDEVAGSDAETITLPAGTYIIKVEKAIYKFQIK